MTLRAGLLVGVVLLYVVSIPWYRDPAEPVSIWLGLPDWVTVALGCYVGAAVLNALAWLRTDVPDAPRTPPDGADAPEPASRDAAPRPPGARP